jgi:hypothetical protein
MKSVFIYIIRQDIIGNLKLINEQGDIYYYPEYPMDYICFFTPARYIGDTRKANGIEEGKVRVNNILNMLGENKFMNFKKKEIDFIGCAIHANDWGIDRGYLKRDAFFPVELSGIQAIKDEILQTKQFKDFVKETYCKHDGKVEIKLFTHDSFSFIYDNVGDQFCTQDFQHIIFNNRTKEQLETILYEYRVILSSLKMAENCGIQRKDILTEDVKTKLERIFDGGEDENNIPFLGFKDYLEHGNETPEYNTAKLALEGNNHLVNALESLGKLMDKKHEELLKIYSENI